MAKKRVAAYARVSTNSRAQEHSFEFQSRYWNQTLGNNDEYEYIGLFADKGISGKYANRRPQFLALMELCSRGEVDIIFTKSVQRFARNAEELLKYVRELRRKRHRGLLRKREYPYIKSRYRVVSHNRCGNRRRGLDSI